jgi:hypothetical protein
MSQTATVDRPAVAPARELTHPLQTLKGIIRRFVAYDVLLFVALYLSVWFWAGVGVDYGLFKGFGLDVAQQLTPWIRVGITVALLLTLVGLVVWRVTVLLNKEFSLSALALVLEKRYPKVLGDRLITAIQMADVEKASRAGYSADLVRHTIDEARERMAQVNVRSVFNWGRLWVKVGLIAAVWVLAIGTAYGIHSLATGGFTADRATKKLTDTCEIFTERNVQFQPTPWPRKAHIEVTDFDDEGHPNELRIGKGAATPPKVQARAVKWVVADDPWKNPDGWRAMTAGDLAAFGVALPPESPTVVGKRAFTLDWTAERTVIDLSPDQRIDAIERAWDDAKGSANGLMKEKAELLAAAGTPADTSDARGKVWAARVRVSELELAELRRRVSEERWKVAADVRRAAVAKLDKAAPKKGATAEEREAFEAQREAELARLAEGEATLTKLEVFKDTERHAHLKKLAGELGRTLEAEKALLGDAAFDAAQKRLEELTARIADAEAWAAAVPAAAAVMPPAAVAGGPVGWVKGYEGFDVPAVAKATAERATALAKALDDRAAPLAGFTLIADLEPKADELANTRKLRKLEVPAQLKMRVDGLQTRSRNFLDLLPDAGGKYVTEVANLSESVKFTVAAEDFVTARRQITLVPPPTFVDLFRDEYQPGYMHYSAPILTDEERQRLQISTDLFALRGRSQKLANRKISITSDKSVFSAPVGTELHITAEADKDLKLIEIRPLGPNPLAVPEFLRAEAKEETRDEKGVIQSDRFVDMPITRPSGTAVETRLELDRPTAGKGLRVAEADFQNKKLGVRRFTLKFEGKRAIRQLDKPTEFQIAMTDTDNVTSVRTIAVTALDDAPPQVEVLVDPVIRKVAGGYMVTPIARVPFLPDSKIGDDHGLSSVRFEFRKTAEEAASLVALRAMAAAAMTANSLAPSPSWAMPATVVHSQTQFDLIFGSTIPQTDSSGNVKLPGVEVPKFETEQKNLQRLILGQLDEATVPRDGGDWLDRLVKAELASNKVNVEGMPPAELAARRAAVLARLRAERPGQLKEDRGPQVVKSIKLSDAKADAFDLQQYMPELLETRLGVVQQRYKVELFVAAKDVNVELTGKDGKPTEPKSARNLDPIRLIVVSEQDLLVEIGKDEEMQVTRMEDVMTKATGGKSKLDREFSLIRTLPALGAKEKTDQMLSSQVRLTDITQDLGKVREILTAMKTEYEKLYREMDVNRFAAPNMRKYKNEAGTAEDLQTGYLDLLALVLDDGKVLSKAEKSMEAVRGTLAASQAPTDAALTEATTDYQNLMRLLNRLSDQVITGNTLMKSLTDLKKILDNQISLGDGIEKERVYREGELRRPALVLPKDVTKVQAGKSVKVKLGVRWKLYPETSLFVGIDPPAAAELTMPKELIVKAKGEEDVTEVEVEVTAGTKTGVHTVTLRPGAFKPVELQIEVTK